MSGAGEGWDGYSKVHAPAEDRRPVDSAFSGLWPPGTKGVDAAGSGQHQQQPKTTQIYDGPAKPGGKRPAPKPVPGGRKKRKRGKSTT